MKSELCTLTNSFGSWKESDMTFEIESARHEIKATYWHERGSYQLIYRALVNLYGEDCDRVVIMANALHEELTENFDLAP